MTTIKAMNKLREWANVSWEPWAESRERLRKMLDEIESEIEERYMPLPLDADGVPIHPGDDLYDEDTGEHIPGEFVYGVSDKYVYIWHEGHNLYHGISGRYPDHFRHRPRTLEDVLRDYACDFADSSGPGYDEEVTKRYAKEIRELLGVGE